MMEKRKDGQQLTTAATQEERVPMLLALLVIGLGISVLMLAGMGFVFFRA